MNRRDVLSALAAPAVLMCSNVAARAERGWAFLGDANVDGAVDHDRIVVTRARGEFRAIQLRVKNASVEFDRVVIHFGNGSSEPIHIRNVIPAGGHTREIDLPGGRRVIQSVEFWYRKANWGRRRPKVLLYGRG